MNIALYKLTFLLLFNLSSIYGAASSSAAIQKDEAPAKTKQLLLQAVQKGNSDAMHQLGCIYYYQKQDRKKGLHYLNMSAAQDNPIAYMHIGNILYDNPTTDTMQSLDWVKKFGFDCSQVSSASDIKTVAKACLDVAAKTGLIDAMHILGAIHLEEGSLTKVEHLLKQSYHHGHEEAVPLLGYALWLQGKPDEAMRLFESIIVQDPPHASMLGQLGALYKEKIGDRSKAKQLYKRAIKIGDILAKNNLGVLYEEDGNIEKALLLYREAVEASIYANLNIFYIHGYHRELPRDELVKCLKRIKNASQKVKNYQKQWPMRWALIAQVIKDLQTMPEGI